MRKISATSMFEIPSRDSLSTLADAANAVAAVAAIGFARSAENDRVSVIYSYPHGVGGFEIPSSGLPAALVPSSRGAGHVDPVTLRAERDRAAEAFLLDNHTERLVSIPLPGVEPPARFWIGLASPDALSADQQRRFAALAAEAARLLSERPSRDAQFARLTRLEQAAGLIPALLHVLDVREVIDQPKILAPVDGKPAPHRVSNALSSSATGSAAHDQCAQPDSVSDERHTDFIGQVSLPRGNHARQNP